MSVSAGWHCSTSATMLSWPGKTWQSCSLRLAVSSGLRSAPSYCLCWCPASHPLPCPLPLPRLPPRAASRAPPIVRSRKFRTSVWERGGLEEGKAVATPAKEWFPGSGVLRGNTELKSENTYMQKKPCNETKKVQPNPICVLIPVLWA